MRRGSAERFVGQSHGPARAVGETVRSTTVS
jgi:hypothetical protein